MRWMCLVESESVVWVLGAALGIPISELTSYEGLAILAGWRFSAQALPSSRPRGATSCSFGGPGRMRWVW